MLIRQPAGAAVILACDFENRSTDVERPAQLCRRRRSSQFLSKHLAGDEQLVGVVIGFGFGPLPLAVLMSQVYVAELVRDREPMDNRMVVLRELDRFADQPPAERAETCTHHDLQSSSLSQFSDRNRRASDASVRKPLPRERSGVGDTRYTFPGCGSFGRDR